MRPKNGEEGLLSAQPDSRSSRAVMNAKMGPASRVGWSGGLIATEALCAAGRIKPDGEPGGFVVQSNRVALGTGEGALTAGSGDAGEGSAAINGYRCARNIDRD